MSTEPNMSSTGELAMATFVDDIKKPEAPSAPIHPAGAAMVSESHDLAGIFIEGRRGDLNDVLGHLLEENQRNPGKSCVRGLLSTMLGITGIGACYLLSKHYLVPQGYVAVTLNNGHPEVIGPGRHVLLSPLNGDVTVVPVTSPRITKGNLDIITVQDDQLALGFDQGRPLMLGPGVHVMTSAYWKFTKFVRQSDPVITHGTVHRVIIQEGQRGLAWEGDKPCVLRAGVYNRVSPLFKFVKSVPIDQEVAVLEPFSIITVDEGRVGVSFDRGQLRVLPSGEHWLNAQTNQKFLDFLPTTQQVRELKTLDVLTTDGLMVRIRGSITFRISDPDTAVKNIGSENPDGYVERKNNITNAMISTIMRRANDTLASLLTGTEVLSSAGLGFSTSGIIDNADQQHQRTAPMVSPDHMIQEKKEGEGELNSLIRQRFKESLTTTLRDEWGVELRDMNVIDIEVMDTSVRNALAEGVRSNIVTVTDRRTAESKAETARILAAGERDAAKIRTDGEAYGVEEVARAQKAAGELLESTPVAVEIRLAETAARAVGNSKSTMFVAPDVTTKTLMSLIGAASRVAASK